MDTLKARVWILLTGLVVGSATSVVSAVSLAYALKLDPALVGGLYAKSVTAPIAMGIAERLHTSPTLTAIYAVLDALKIKAWWQRGFAMGLAAHGIGTSRAFSVSAEAGTYASLAMGLNGVMSAVLIPVLIQPF